MIPRQLRKQKSAKRYPQIGSNVINPSRLGFVLFYFIFRFCFPPLRSHSLPPATLVRTRFVYTLIITYYIMYEMIIRTVHLWIYFFFGYFF